MRIQRLAICLLLIVSGCTTEAELARLGLLPTPDAGVASAGAKLPKTLAAQSDINDIRQRFQVEPSPIVKKAIGGSRKPVLPPSDVTSATVDSRGRVAVEFDGRSKLAKVDLAENAADGFDLSRESDGFSIKVKLQGAKTSLAEEADGYVVYRNAHNAGSTLVHRVTPNGTEDYLVIDSAPLVPEIRYQVHLGKMVGGLRLVGGTLDFEDSEGVARIRIPPPWIVDHQGTVVPATISVVGCAVDTTSREPSEEPVTPPGSNNCTVVLSWDHNAVSYPILLDPTWSTNTPSMGTPRFTHAAATYIDSLTIAGGISNLWVVLKTVEHYNRATNTWIPDPPMNTGRALFTLSAVPNPQVQNPTKWNYRLVAIGGLTVGSTNSVEQFGYPWSAWVNSNSTLGWEMQQHTATALPFVYSPSGDPAGLLVYGGFDSNSIPKPIHRCYRWVSDKLDNCVAEGNGPGGSWCPTGWGGALAPHRRAAQTATVLTGNKLVVAGGLGNLTYAGPGDVDVTTTLIYDISNPGATIPCPGYGPATTGRSAHSAIALPGSNRILLVGGHIGAQNGPPQSVADIFDYQTPQPFVWQVAGTSPNRAFMVSAALPNGAALVAGGSTEPLVSTANISDSVDVFDPSSNAWVPSWAGPMAIKRHVGAGGLIQMVDDGPFEKMLVAGGSAGTTQWDISANAQILTMAAEGEACTSWTQCVAGMVCSAGLCQRRSPTYGASCGATGPACTGGSTCVDGFCCDTACSNGCDRCDVTGKEGKCSAVPTGTVCSTGAYLCIGVVGCPTTCGPPANDLACAPGYYCDGANHCVSKLANGQACTSATSNRCASGFCAQNVCCNSQCNAFSSGCEACNVNNGPGQDHTGTCWDNGSCTAIKRSPLPTDPGLPEPRGVVTSVFDSAAFLGTTGLGYQSVDTSSTSGIFDPFRASIIHGRVFEKDPAGLASNGVLPGATVTVLNHSEYGNTVTRLDGQYDLMVNGGETIVLNIAMNNHPTVQRQVYVPYQDYVAAPDAVLTQYPNDPNNPTAPNPKTLMLGSGYSAMRVDVAGDSSTRTSFMVFPPDVRTKFSYAGHADQTGTSPKIWVTEFTKKKDDSGAMPGPLPPTSAYTYAVDFNVVDNANPTWSVTNVNFVDAASGNPATAFYYVDNFLGFPLPASGASELYTTAPFGSYDPVAANWVANPSLGNLDGALIEVYGFSAGAAQVRSKSGQSSPAASLNIASGELQELYTLYNGLRTPPFTLWRVPMQHFTDWDVNWSIYPPDNASFPPPGAATSDEHDDCSAQQSGSIIECQNQTLGERIPVAGTPFSLNYRSDRQPGRKATVTIPITGPSFSCAVPPCPQPDAVYMQLFVAGRLIERTVCSSALLLPCGLAPNQKGTITWDGLDPYGRPLTGQRQAHVRVGYGWGTTYAKTSRFGYGAGGKITGTSARTELVFWSADQPVTVSSWDARSIGLGGWDLNVHHVYDPYARTIYYGDGRRRTAAAIGRVLSTLSGTQVDAPVGTNDLGASVVGPDGTVYFADRALNKISKRTPAGTVTVLVGSTNIKAPTALAISGAGRLYAIAAYPSDQFTERVFQVDTTSGALTLIAGTGARYVSLPNGDGGGAASAFLGDPDSIAVAPTGEIYITEPIRARLRAITPDGLITTIAGQNDTNPTAALNPDTAVAFQAVKGVSAATDGNVYFVGDAGRVYRLSPQWRVTRIAGGPAGGVLSDGDVATAHEFGVQPAATAVGADGSIFLRFGLSGSKVSAIRRIGVDGILTTVAGDTVNDGTYQGDGGPALGPNLGRVQSISFGPSGDLYFTDNNGGYAGTTLQGIRRLQVPYPNQVRPPGVGDVAYTLASEDGAEIYTFDQAGRHLQTLNGLTSQPIYTFGYDATTKQLTGVTEGAGNKVTSIDYATSKITAPFGHVTQLSFDNSTPWPYLIGIADPTGGATTLAYDSGGLLVKLTDPRSNIHTFTHDSQGRLIADGNPAGGIKTLTRNPASPWRISISSAEGYTTVYDTSSSSNEMLQTTTAPTGLSTSTRTYKDDKRIITHPDSTVVTLTSSNDLRFGRQDPLVSRTVTSSGLTRVQTASNTALHLSTQSDPLTMDQRTDQVMINNDPNKVFVTSYDATGLPAIPRKITRTTPTGRTLISELDSLGRVTKVKVPGIDDVTINYDTSGRGIQSVSQNGRTSLIGYNGLTTLGYGGGLPATITDPASNVTTFGNNSSPNFYDAAGRVKQFTLPDVASSQMILAYDPGGNRTSLTPPGKTAHSFGFDAVDANKSYTPPQVQGELPTSYVFNRDGQLTKWMRPDGSSVLIDYDSAGRLASIVDPSTPKAYGYSYNSGGHVASITLSGQLHLNYTYGDGTGGALRTEDKWTWASSGSTLASVGRSFDNEFRLASATVKNSAGTEFNRVYYAYDNDGLLCASSPSASPTCTTSQTAAGGLTILRDPAGAGCTGGICRNGLPTSIQLGVSAGPHIKESFTYNSFGELASATTVARSSGGADNTRVTFNYVSQARDPLGRVRQKIDTIDGTATTTTYEYNGAGRLTKETVGTTISCWSYDVNGNRTPLVTPACTTAQFAPVYDAQDRLRNYGAGLSYNYSGNGDLSTRVGSYTSTFAYDASGNLLSVKFSGGGTLPADITYAVDGQNRRIERKQGTTTQRFLYDGQLRIVAELDGTGSVVSRFVYGIKPNVPEYMIQPNGGNPIYYRIITDQLGSVRLVLRVSDGMIMQRLDYDAWGVTTEAVGGGFQPFGFAGGLYDRTTKLVRFGARDYDPEIGRWTNKDPIGFEGGDTNLYAYSGNDPVNQLDPFGLDFWSAAGNFAAGVGEALVGGVIVAGVAAVSPLLAVGLVAYGAVQAGIAIGEAISGTDADGNPISTDKRIDKGARVCGNVVGGVVSAWGYGRGYEQKLPFLRGPTGKPMRIAPWGNRTGHPFGELPHYHRAISDPANPGNSLPGQGMPNHRPWEGGF